MASPTQLIFTDNPGDLPATYTVPASLEIVVSSIFARFDGSGAGGDFVPTLDLLSQNGNLMARVAVTQTLAAGDEARVTWAPFLRRQAAATPPPAGASLSYATAIKGTTNLTPINANFHTKVIDLGTGTAFRTNDPTRLQLVDDTPNTPQFGIAIPGGLLVQVMTGLQCFGLGPDGQVSTDWVISGAYTVRQEGPLRTSPSAAGFANPLTDDFSGPQSIQFIDHLSSAADWVIGLTHNYDNWTNGAKDFRYGLTVTILGDRPT